MLERDGEDAAVHFHHTGGLMRNLVPEADLLQRIVDLSA
jgi:hypothetical protein